MASYQTLINPANLTFDDEFNSFVWSPDGSVGWMTSFYYGGEAARALPSDGQAEYLSDASVGVNPFSDQNGVLDITATVAPAGSNPYGQPYNSGMITTYKSFAQTYGYFEIDADLPAGQGLWPAFYLLPTNIGYQTELDVFEVLGNSPGTLYTTVHWEVNGVWHATTTIVNVANTSAGFNTYGVDWEPTTTTIYMDGQVIATFATPANMDLPMYMLAGLGVGSAGSWPGAPTSNAEFPATMQINYVRAYATANTIEVSGPQAIETSAVTGQLLMAGAGWMGATVSLLNAAGTVIATTTTNAAGTFSFANLPAGSYQLRYALPPGLAVQGGSPAAAGTGLTAAFSLTDGQTMSMPSEVLLAPQNPASISSNVGMFGGPNDTTLLGGDAGVTVSLLDGSGNVIASAITDSNGNFVFNNLAAGTYRLDYTPAAGQTIQPLGNANATTGLTAQFTVAVGQNTTAPSGSMVPLGSIDGMVVLNGVGEAGVTVSVLNAAGAVVATATTNSAGDVAFTDLLAAGTYQLAYKAPSGQVFQTGGAANAGTGITPSLTLSISQVLTAATEQLLSNPATISAVAMHFDAPTDNSWGTGEGGVTVSLLNSAGVVIATTVSPNWGGFSFSDIGPGTYALEYTAPAGQAFLPGGTDNPVSGETAAFTVAAGQSVAAPNGDLVTLSSIGGAVLLAAAGEANVVVSLLNANGAVIATTATNSAGAFTFSGLAAGNYQVKYAAPAGLVLQTGSEANAVTGLTSTIALAYSQTVTLPAEQLLSNPATIQSSVLHFGAPTDPVSGSADAGVTVSLLNAAGSVIATTVSAANGGFSFGNIGAGTYQLGYTAPSGQTIELGSQANVTTGLTAQFSVAAGQTVTGPGGSMISLNGSISGAVTVGGVAEAGVAVALLSSAGKVLATTTTSSAGFTFNGLGGGSYEVKYTAPSGQVFQTGSEASATTGITPVIALANSQALTLATEQLLSSPGTISSVAEHFGGPTDASWGSGEGGVTVSLLNAAGTVIATTVSPSWGGFSFGQIGAGIYQLQYTLPAGQGFKTGSPDNPATGLTAQFSVTAGQTVNAPQGWLISNTVGGTVLLGGVGEAGVTVSLLTTSGTVVTTTTTGSTGAYLFTGMATGTYEVGYAAPSGQVLAAGSEANAASGLTPAFTITPAATLTLPSELLLSNPATITSKALHFGGSADPVGGSAEAGVTVSLLNAVGTVIATTTTNAGGIFSFGQLAAGTYQLQYAAPVGQAIDPAGPENTATGLTAQFAVAAAQTVTAPVGELISNTVIGTVLLGGVGEAGVTVSLLNTTGTVVATTTTGSNGAYTFTGMPAGSYQVAYAPPLGQAIDPAGPENAATGLTAQFAVATGQTVTAPTGELVSTTVMGSVLLSGVGEAGVTVSLLTTAGAVIATTTTGSNGAYTFTGMAAGSYQVAYTPPLGQAVDPAGPENIVTDLTAPFTVAAGQTVTAPTGKLIPAGIAGEVTLAGAAEAGVAVSLLSTAGKVLATTTTNSAGGFAFAGLAAGSYEVKYAAPSGQVFQTGSEASATTGITPVITTLASNQAVMLATEQLLSSPGTISAVVEHFGATTDASWGTGEGGVTVSLLNAAGTVIATTVSPSWGGFSFTDIGPGTYQLRYAAPAGQGFKPGSPDNPATGLTAQFTVTAGQTVSAPQGWLMTTIVMNGANLTDVAPAGAYLVTGNASNSTVTLGAGNQFVTLTGGGDTVTAGAGGQTITLGGTGNTVTVGVGTSTINAGSGQDTVHAAGGNITINATGGGNLFDSGGGMSFLNADGSASNVFMLNTAANGSMATITGFNPAANDILDLKRTLAGTSILPDLSNVGSLVTSALSGANTVLYAAPAGGGTPLAFATLDGVHVTVAQLQTAHEWSLT